MSIDRTSSESCCCSGTGGWWWRTRASIRRRRGWLHKKAATAVAATAVAVLSAATVRQSLLQSSAATGGGLFFGQHDDDFFARTRHAQQRRRRDEESVLMALLMTIPQEAATAATTATAKDAARIKEQQRGGGGGGARIRSATAAATTPTFETAHNTTLALLFPPGLQGGYRNQVLRFVALCRHALINHQTLFLPSVWWSTQRKVPTTRTTMPPDATNATERQYGSSSSSTYVWYPVPMDLIFDVNHWNEYATMHPGSLPVLVNFLPPRPGGDGDDQAAASNGGDCWSARDDDERAGDAAAPADFLQSELQKRGRLVPLENYTKPLVQWPPGSSSTVESYNPRRDDLLPLVSHCQRPHVYGGGTMAGRLWNEYLSLTKATSGGASDNNHDRSVYASVLRALQPKPEWRKVGIEHCLVGSTDDAATRNDSPKYAALHARVEPEMMAHPCGRNMERNLTAILGRVATFLFHNHTTTNNMPLSTIVVAVSRDGLVDPRFPKFQELSKYNLRVLDQYTSQNKSSWVLLLHDRYRVLECGGEMMDRYYRSQKDDGGGTNMDSYGTLLEQVINFDVAVQSAVFVGVDQSSYSNAVWTTRYLLNKGANYRYTTSGIEEVVGMPPPHSNCARTAATATAASNPRRTRRQKKGR